MRPLVCILRCDITFTRLGFITLTGNKPLSPIAICYHMH